MKKELEEKLTNVVELVNNASVNPDINIDYYIPDSPTGDFEPYVQIEYANTDTHSQQQKVPIKNYLNKTPEDIANLITFHIEQFMEQVDSLEYGPQ